jgi:hypothetical protein
MSFLAAEWQLPQSEDELRTIAHDSDGFYEFIKREGYEVFVKLELCLGGNWKNRLSRLLHDGHLSLISPGDGFRPRAEDAIAQELSRAINARRDDPRYALNNQVDGHALSELHHKMKDGLVVRFYTETEALRNAIAQSGLLADDHSNSVLREEEYFLVRSSFRALGFNRDSALQPELAGTLPQLSFDIGTFSEIRDKLASILEGRPTQDDPVLEEALKREEVRGVTLSELVNGFYNLSFLDSIFLTWSPPIEMQRWLPTLYELKSDQDGVLAGAQQKVTTSLTRIFRQMERQIGQLRDWREDFNRISEAVEERVSDLGGHTPDLWKDLGLGRWGLESVLLDATSEKIKAGIHAILGDAQTRAILSSNLAIQLAYKPHNPEMFAYLASMLWFLRLDRQLKNLFQSTAKKIQSRYARDLRILFLVARVRTATEERIESGSLYHKLEAIIAEAEADVEKARSEQNPWVSFTEMGVAHVTYWAWRETGEQLSGRGFEWAQKSFDAARRAEQALDRGTLGWAFAVNHCAYMGLRAGINAAVTNEYVLDLIQRIPKSHYHYRFADTIAWSYTSKVERLTRRLGLEQLESDTKLDRDREELCSDVKEAKRLLTTVPSFGDIEVKRHLEVIHYYDSRLGCARAQLSEQP